MTVELALDRNGKKLWLGHVLDVLQSLPADSVQCVVTSPPYWGLRAYGTDPQVWGGDPECEHEWLATPPRRERSLLDIVDLASKQAKQHASAFDATGGILCTRCGAWRGELGAEPTPALFVEHLVQVCREIRRVLRPDGVFWLNIGDSYGGSGKGPSGHNGIGDQAERQGFTGGQRGVVKPKDLCLIPERLAIALQDDGWWVRSRIAWCKTSAMPESTSDRPTSAWEHIWMLTKSRHYYYDADAVRTPGEAHPGNAGSFDREGSKRGTRLVPGNTASHRNGRADRVQGGANLRNFWLLGPEPLAEAHFATFPSEVPGRAILASTSEKGACSECGKPWKRVVESLNPRPSDEAAIAQLKAQGVSRQTANLYAGGHSSGNKWGHRQTTGWAPGCKHDAPIRPCIVLDPFVGSGTTMLVANRFGREAWGIELNEKYAQIALGRLAQDSLFGEVTL